MLTIASGEKLKREREVFSLIIKKSNQFPYNSVYLFSPPLSVNDNHSPLTTLTNKGPSGLTTN